MTREERNVLLFVAAGIVLGSLPEIRGANDLVEARGAPDSAVVVDLFPIDLNRADAALLDELPGIGPAKAAAIVALRESRGRFETVEELRDVHGIGPRTVERLRSLVHVGKTDPPGGIPSRGIERENSSLVGTPRVAPHRQRDHRRGTAVPGEEAAEGER